MTRMLASISNLQEAAIVLSARVDIIDLKNPVAGALGRLASEEIKKIVHFVDGRSPISATIGDLPMDVPLIFKAVEEIAATGVDFIKIGLSTDKAGRQIIENLTRLTANNKLIAVLFADQALDLSSISSLKIAGFAGIMLDTFDKSQGSLLEVMTKAKIEDFVNKVQAEGLLCGLAGSLKQADISDLLTIKPDYLGFRGALCSQLKRTNAVDTANVYVIKNLISDSC